MSDVTVAPDGGGAPPAAANEVTINPEQRSTPNPIGSQAPDAPVGDFEGSKHRPESRREAIQRNIDAAFERANKPPAKDAKPVAKPAERPAPKAADAKPGHNNPPEETEKFDLRKRPPAEDPPRGERGRFAPRQAATNEGGNVATNQAANVAHQQQAGQAATPYVNKLPPNAPFREPPARMSESAKRDWDKTPDTVRGDVHRLGQEFLKAYNYYKGDAEAFKTVKHFHQMAASHGTTLEKALTNYVSMEHKLRADPIGGLDTIVNNLGLKTPDGEPLGLRDIAYSILNQSPDQLRSIQQGNQQQALMRQVQSQRAELEEMKNYLHRAQEQQQVIRNRMSIDQFAEQRPRFDELSDLILNEINLGFPLEVAYRRAELLRPDHTAAQTRTTPAQTRQTTDRSISGSHDVAPSNGASRRPREPSRSPRDAVLNAMKHVGGF